MACCVCGRELKQHDPSFRIEIEIPANSIDLLLVLSEQKELRICGTCAEDEDNDSTDPDPDPILLQTHGG